MQYIIFMANYKKDLFDHQRTAVSECRRKNPYVFAYLMEMGTGKTITTIHDMLDLYSDNKINVVIIFGPKSVYRNWHKEIRC